MKKIYQKPRLLLFALTIILTSQTINAQSTLILQPDAAAGKDAVIQENIPNTNNGNSLEFLSFAWTFSGSTAIGFSLIQFDLSSLPVGSTITSAALSLYYNPTSGSAGQAGANACNLKKVTSSWDENLVTWNNMPTTTSTGQVLLASSTTTNQDYLNIDLTNFVIGWHTNPATNNGLMLEIINQTIYKSMKFCSSDYSNANLRPKLVINYTTSTNSLSENSGNELTFDLFPNPTSDFTTVSLNDFSNENASIEILNAKGQIVQPLRKLESSEKIDVSEYSKGIYYIKIHTKQAISTRKLIVE